MRSADELLAIGDDVVKAARRAGADQAEAFVREGEATSITYKGPIALPTESHDLGIGLRVLVGNRPGFAAAAGVHQIELLAKDAVDATKGAPTNRTPTHFSSAIAPARAPTLIPKALAELDPHRLEAAALTLHEALDAPESTFRAVSVVSARSRFAITTSEGLATYDQTARETLDIENRVSNSTRDVTAWDGRVTLGPIDQEVELERLAQDMVQRGVDALDAKPLDRPVDEIILGHAPAGQVVATFVRSLSGRAVHAGQSALADRLDEPVASPSFTLYDRPFDDDHQRLRIDHEGTPTSAKVLVERGVLRRYLYDQNTAQQHGTESTGNAVRGGWRGAVGVGPIHPSVAPGDASCEDLIAGADRAVYIPDAFTGMFTANQTTGDFSVVVPYSFLVESGAIAHALPNASLGGNVFDMLRSIRAIGNDPADRSTGTSCTMHMGGVSLST